MIDLISLKNVVPDVFLNNNSRIEKSDIWGKELEFKKGTRYLIESHSGSGKTTLCSFLMGARNDYRGSILFDAQNTSKLKSKDWCEIRQKSLAWLTQELDLFGELTVLENIRLKNLLTHFRTENFINDLLGIFDLKDKIHTKAKFLSVGQQQRLAFIRLLCQPADFFIMDEPVSHLDNSNNQLMSDILNQLLVEEGSGLILTSVGNRLNTENSIILNL